MKSISAFLCLIGASFTLLVTPVSADRKIRVHFVAASFSWASDQAENSKLLGFSSRASYDAIWEATVPSGLPTGYGIAKRVSGSGFVQFRSKDGLQNCDGELTLKSPDSFANISVYNINGDEFAITIAAPHRPGILGNGPAGTACSEPIFVTQGPGEGVSTTPPYTGIPNFPGTSSPPEISGSAAFVINEKNPETSRYFSFVQTASFPQLAYQSKSVWFGYVNVELNPNKQLPGSVDPPQFFNYPLPASFQPPSDPPGSPPKGGSGGGTTVTPKEITKYIRDPIIKQIVDALQGLQAVWNSISQGQSQTRSLHTRAYVEPNGSFTYDAATRTLTLLAVEGAPAAGTASVKIGVGDGNPKSAGKGLAVQAGGTQNLVLTLPATLTKAFSKGKKFSTAVVVSFAATGNKKAKGSVTKKATIKKRS